MFTTELLLASSPKPDFWIVRAPLVWAATQLPPTLSFSVPVGFETDLASIPRALRNLPAFDPDGLSRRAAVGHDWLYWWQGWGKDKADDFLRTAMLADGCNMVDATAFHDAVKWFGYSAWMDAERDGLASHFDTPVNFQAWVRAQHTAPDGLG